MIDSRFQKTKHLKSRIRDDDSIGSRYAKLNFFSFSRYYVDGLSFTFSL